MYVLWRESNISPLTSLTQIQPGHMPQSHIIPFHNPYSESHIWNSVLELLGWDYIWWNMSVKKLTRILRINVNEKMSRCNIYTCAHTHVCTWASCWVVHRAHWCMRSVHNILFYFIDRSLTLLVIWQCPVADRRKNPRVWGEGPSNATKNKTGKSYRNGHETHLKKCQ